VLCIWPKGGRPRHPMVYCDETWTGVEYSVAASLIYEGFVEEGLKLVKAVRDRYDGYKRNQWNEVECGSHYVWSMASWAVLLALSGFACDIPEKRIYFNPRVNRNNFRTFWSTGTAWGTYSRVEKSGGGPVEHKVEVLYGTLDGVEVIVDGEVAARL
jgi:non-lysosomal glucosylceramidase